MDKGNKMKTYQETVLRFRVLMHTEYPEEYKAEMRINGIDPDDNWSLIYSSNTLENAEDIAAEQREIYNRPIYTVKVVDNGEATVIERPIY